MNLNRRKRKLMQTQENRASFTDLHAMYSQARSRIQLLVTGRAFEVFCFLMLNKNLVVIEFPVAIPKLKLTEILKKG